jgi:hypothetical protein
MDKKAIMKNMGSMQQVAYVRPLTFTEGYVNSCRAYSVKNGPLQFLVMTDKCLDISECSYKGININFLSKPGLIGRNHFDTHGEEALRSIMGGLFFTCGLENICSPCTDSGKEFPMHGRLRSTPAEHVCADALWENGQYILRLQGEMREAELFGENLLLRRTIQTEYGSRSITITDEIENCGFRDEVMMLMYHFNAGYPLLCEGARIILPSIEALPRDDISKAGLNHWDIMDAPKDNAPEQVFIHYLAKDKNGRSFGAVINDTINLGLLLEFDTHYLPLFMEWKSTASGDYVIGLEPANSSVYGRLKQKEQGLHMLAPFAKERIELQITILEGSDEIQAICQRAKNLIHSTSAVCSHSVK